MDKTADPRRTKLSSEESSLKNPRGNSRELPDDPPESYRRSSCMPPDDPPRETLRRRSAADDLP
jgi:hypothetical protein